MNRWGLFVEGQQEEGILPALPGLGFGMSMFIPALGGHGDHPRDGAGNFPVGPRCSGVQIRMRRGGEELFAGGRFGSSAALVGVRAVCGRSGGARMVAPVDGGSRWVT